MAATFEWDEDNGTATGSPAKGTTRTTAVTNVNWKDIDDATTAYSSNPITAGQNSYQKNQFGKFSGTFNQILGGLFAHTSTAFGTGLTLKGDGDRDWIGGGGGLRGDRARGNRQSSIYDDEPLLHELSDDPIADFR